MINRASIVTYLNSQVLNPTRFDRFEVSSLWLSVCVQKTWVSPSKIPWNVWSHQTEHPQRLNLWNSSHSYTAFLCCNSAPRATTLALKWTLISNPCYMQVQTFLSRKPVLVHSIHASEQTVHFLTPPSTSARLYPVQNNRREVPERHTQGVFWEALVLGVLIVNPSLRSN